ncbi:MAG: FkbM family methyltransferase [Pirellulaceae bacterium]|nr:FkbM family methyltransferase [Pirellulaceae bacterium]
MIYRAVRRFNVLKAMVGRETFHWVDRRIATEFHGSSYGGWAIARDSLNASSIVYSVGIGQDATFDQSLMERYGLSVYAYDPTPKSVAWVREHVSTANFKFHPIALSDQDGFLDFYEPNPNSADQVSASVHQSHAASTAYQVPCQIFDSLLRSNGHVGCDVLKMDIEGAEYPVLKQLCQNGSIAKVKQLLVEFHHFFPGIGIEATNTTVSELRRQGFRIAWISRTNHEYLFVREAA